LARQTSTSGAEKNLKADKADKYAFYTMLPKKKVVMLERYELEVMRSKDVNVVNRKKAALALLSLEPNITEVKGKSGVLYRLVLGPYDAKQDAIDVQADLKKKAIHSSLQKI
jgi:cell division protein FtsN